MRTCNKIIIHLLDAGVNPYGTFVLNLSDMLEEHLAVSLIAEATKLKMLMVKWENNTMLVNVVAIDPASVKQSISNFLLLFTTKSLLSSASVN